MGNIFKVNVNDFRSVLFVKLLQGLGELGLIGLKLCLKRFGL
jgi:hypothetical protein